MDKYKKLMAVEGLIVSLKEQIYRIDNLKEDGITNKPQIHKNTIMQYYDSIVKFLNESDNEKA